MLTDYTNKILYILFYYEDRLYQVKVRNHTECFCFVNDIVHCFYPEASIILFDDDEVTSNQMTKISITDLENKEVIWPKEVFENTSFRHTPDSEKYSLIFEEPNTNKAVEIAKEHFESVYSGEFVICSNDVTEKEYGWVVSFGSKKGYETGCHSIMNSICGGYPVLIEKNTWKVIPLTPGYDFEEALKKYEYNRLNLFGKIKTKLFWQPFT